MSDMKELQQKYARYAVAGESGNAFLPVSAALNWAYEAWPNMKLVVDDITHLEELGGRSVGRCQAVAKLWKDKTLPSYSKDDPDCQAYAMSQLQVVNGAALDGIAGAQGRAVSAVLRYAGILLPPDMQDLNDEANLSVEADTATAYPLTDESSPVDTPPVPVFRAQEAAEVTDKATTVPVKTEAVPAPAKTEPARETEVLVAEPVKEACPAESAAKAPSAEPEAISDETDTEAPAEPVSGHGLMSVEDALKVNLDKLGMTIGEALESERAKDAVRLLNLYAYNYEKFILNKNKPAPVPGSADELKQAAYVLSQHGLVKEAGND